MLLANTHYYQPAAYVAPFNHVWCTYYLSLTETANKIID